MKRHISFTFLSSKIDSFFLLACIIRQIHVFMTKFDTKIVSTVFLDVIHHTNEKIAIRKLFDSDHSFKSCSYIVSLLLYQFYRWAH